MDKILSIIIPTYNMEGLLQKDLKSLVVDSGLEKLEVLVVNDGSKDRSSEIAHEFENAYPGVFKVIDKENGNYGSCINAALKMVTGKYVRIMDADDSLLTSNLEEFIRFLEESDVDLVFSDYIKYYGENDQEEIVYSLPAGDVCRSENYYDSEAFGAIQMPAVTYRTDIFGKIGYHQTEGISYTDMEWCFAPMSEVNTFRYFNKPLYCYLLNREGQTMDINVQLRRFSHVLKSMTTILKAYDRLKPEGGKREYLTGQIVRHLLYIYRFYLVDNKTIDRSALKEFDANVAKLAPEAYKESAEFEYRKKIHYLFVDEWRSGKHEYIPRSVLLKERILDVLGRIHVKLMNSGR